MAMLSKYPLAASALLCAVVIHSRLSSCLHALLHALVSRPSLNQKLHTRLPVLPTSSPSALLRAEIAGSPVQREDFQDFLPHLDGVFELDVTLAEVSNLPHDVQT